MKKNLFIIVLFTCLVNTGYAQYTYTPGKQETANSITFNVFQDSKYVMRLENVENKLSDTLRYKDGTPLAGMDYAQVRINPASGMTARALMETFTETEYEELGVIDDSLIAYCYISTEGKILEISFILGKKWMPYISPLQFAELERNLKKYLTFKVNDFGKRLQYVHAPLFLNFSKIKLPYVSFDVDNQLDADAKFRQPVGFINNERVMK